VCVMDISGQIRVGLPTQLELEVVDSGGKGVGRRNGENCNNNMISGSHCKSRKINQLPCCFLMFFFSSE